MPKIELYQYQEKLAKKLAVALARGVHPIIAQLPTGGGKTVIFSEIINRYSNKSGGRCLIMVHRKELRTQAVKSLKKFYGIDAHEIKAGDRYIPDKMVYCGLVQTLRNRVEKLPDIGITIIDECHLGNFKKLFGKIPGDPYIIGFSATPIAASKKHPLKEYYKDLVMGPQITDLIKIGSLSQNYTFAPKIEIDRDKFRKTSRGDFMESDMLEQFAKQKSIKTTLKAYEKHSKGDKTIIFNVNIEHSLKVEAVFLDSGYNVRHVDGKTKKDERDRIFKWFAETPDAILCNVGIATMGFDEPTIKTVIVNRSTTSLPLWLQMCGRGSRITHTKDTFKIIDLGANTSNLGDWNAHHNWHDKFHNPKKPKDKEGVPPMKDCPECEAIIPARTMECPYCEHEFEERSFEDEKEILMKDFEMITKGIIVQKEINLVNSNGWKEYTGFFRILDSFAKNYDRRIHDKIMEELHTKVKKWHNHFGRHYTKRKRAFTEARFKDKLKEFEQKISA